MNFELLEEALELVEKANAELEPELLLAADARKLMKMYARGEKLMAYGVAALARKVDDHQEVARNTGSSVGKARAVVETGKVMATCDDLSTAMQTGKVSLDQAAQIASAEQSAPGAAKDLLKVAAREPFHVLKDESRRKKLEAEQLHGLADKQRRARCARSFTDALGMMNIHLCLEPHVGAPIVARAEAEAERVAKEAKNKGEDREPFERYLADAYARLLSGQGKGRAKRPELVILVSHEVTKRGWKDVKEGEVCKIPGVGPVAPGVAKEIAQDAFLTGLFYDGEDLRHFKRWTRHIPAEVLLALEIGEPPDFDGPKCVDCGNRFKTQIDHVQPVENKGPTAVWNNKDRCWTCHQAKTERDRQAKLKREREAESNGSRARETRPKRGASGKGPDP